MADTSSTGAGAEDGGDASDGGAADAGAPESDGGRGLSTVALSYRLPWDMQVSARYQYARGNPTTAVTGSVFDSSTNQYLPITSATLGARLPDFHQLDLRVDKAWTLSSRVRLTTFLDVRNVTNQANVVEPLTFAYDYQQQSGRIALPIYPVLGARADF